MTGPISATGLQARVTVTRGTTFQLELDLTVPAGQIVSVLGPNGAGKSTLLATLAGLLPIGSGHIELDGQVLDDPTAEVFRRPERRPIGVVFQDYRLFPHQSVLDNVAFGPRSRGRSRRDARAGARRWLERLELEPFAHRSPGDLSGGQAQRVALARALATEPALLLLDEPLAALDARTRREVQQTLRRHLHDFAGPVVMVTHDPTDALLLADRLVVVEKGRVRQDGSPAAVVREPATAYVAELLDLNLYRGRVEGGRLTLAGGGELLVSGVVDCPAAQAVLRPDAITIHRVRPVAGPSENLWPGIVREVQWLSDRVRVRVEGTPAAVVDVRAAEAEAPGLTEGTAVWLRADPADAHAWPTPS